MAEWTILIEAASGAVSLLTLTSEEKARLVLRSITPEPDPWTDQAIYEEFVEKPRREELMRRARGGMIGGYYTAAGGGGGTPTFPSGYHSVRCWGPDNEPVPAWPEPPDYKQRVAAVREAISVAAKINEEMGHGNR